MGALKLIGLIFIIGSLLGCSDSIHHEQVPKISQVDGINYRGLENKIISIEKKLGARVGISVYDVDMKKELWSYRGGSRFPLMSTFKTLACAKMLHDVEKKKLLLNPYTFIKKESLIEWSPITKNYIGKKFTLKQACSAMMTMSDNTAANIVLKKIGGPKALTLFMQTIGDNTTQLDRMEPDLNEALEGDVRDTTTPHAITQSLHLLLFGDVLSDSSKAQLKKWMMENKVANSLFRSVLPNNWVIADRSGAGGYGSRGITAIVWPKTHKPLIIAVYLTQTKASFDQRNKAIAQIGREIFALYK
ncbi:class A beta-lactamase [Sulfurospirillum sp. 1612]|uniref:class A beta-lactamase n=1 Tax=Sulfurospirillum sp. 1612 TaxID=3094835 RepID=UPI002F93B503